jgi:hypothetical protein
LGHCGLVLLTSRLTGFDPNRRAPGKLAKDRRCKSPTGKV